MGKGAHVRIKNHSTHNVTIVVEDRNRVEDQGIGNIQGELEVGHQLPVEGKDVYEGKYEYLEGEANRAIQKDGSFELVAKYSGGETKIQLCCDHSKWWAKTCEGAGSTTIVLSADVEEEDDGKCRIDIKVYNFIPTNKWMEVMSNVIIKKPLCQVAMPGTHDSGTYDFAEKLGAAPDSDLCKTIQEKLECGPGFIGKIGEKIAVKVLDIVYKRLCQCQDLSIAQQLNEGIRYLDLRVASLGDDQFYTCHGVYCVNMDTILDEVKQFMDAHPKEIIVLDFNHFYAMSANHHTLFSRRVVEKLGGKIANQKGGALRPDSPVGEYWKKGAQAVVIYHDDATQKASDGKFWIRGCIQSKWPNSNESDALKVKLKATIQERPPKMFFVLQGILTPDTELIKKEILESKGSMSIKTIAKRASQKVTNWVENEWHDAIHNIVIVDFFKDCSMVTSIINLNKTQS